MNFTTPEAAVLIVDDNEINLEVTAGLLEPLQMKIDLADSGKRALLMAQQKRYNLIFMDHMMPVMDGVETTKRLRQMKDEYYHTVPIIALTANSLEEVRGEFKAAGMSDYIPKPIEMLDLYECVLKWLPRRLIVVSGAVQKPAGERVVSHEVVKDKNIAGGERNRDGVQEQEGQESGMVGTLPDLPGINAADGIKYTGSEKMWLKLLGDFYKLIDSKANKIERCLADGLIRDYTIEVHAMKNTARMMGAAHLSEWFFRMEKCGKAGDVETITRETPGLMKELRSFKEILRPYGEENNRNKREVPVKELITQLTILRNAMEKFDLDTIDTAMQQLEEYRIPDNCSELMDLLRVGVADLDMKVVDVADEMIGRLQGK